MRRTGSTNCDEKFILPENISLLSGTFFSELFQDPVLPWNFPDVRPTVPMDNVVSCTFERTVSIAQCYGVSANQMAVMIKWKQKMVRKMSEFFRCYCVYMDRIVVKKLYVRNNNNNASDTFINLWQINIYSKNELKIVLRTIYTLRYRVIISVGLVFHLSREQNYKLRSTFFPSRLTFCR